MVLWCLLHVQVNLIAAKPDAPRQTYPGGHNQHAAGGQTMGAARAPPAPLPPVHTRRGLSAKDVEIDAVGLLKPILLDQSHMLVHNQKLDLLEALMAVSGLPRAVIFFDSQGAIGDKQLERQTLGDR